MNKTDKSLRETYAPRDMEELDEEECEFELNDNPVPFL